jgi:hypothetical protein
MPSTSLRDPERRRPLVLAGGALVLAAALGGAALIQQGGRPATSPQPSPSSVSVTAGPTVPGTTPDSPAGPTSTASAPPSATPPTTVGSAADAIELDPHRADPPPALPEPAPPGAAGGEEEGEYEDIAARDAWFSSFRSSSDGQLLAQDRLQAYRQSRRLPLRRTVPERGGEQAEARAAVWESIGPAAIKRNQDNEFWVGPPPYSGRVTSIVPHPIDPKVAYLGGAVGGLWKTTDDGASWTPFPSFDILPSTAVGAIAVLTGGANGADVIYVGTGEANFSGSYYGAGVFRSIDGGASWQLLPIPSDGCSIARVTPSSAETPYTARTFHVVVHGRNRRLGRSNCADASGASLAGLYRSADGGTSWSRLDLVPSDASEVAVEVVADPLRAGTWYAGVLSTDVPANSGIYKSEDDGATWRALPLPPDYSPAGATMRLAVAGDRVYAVQSSVSGSLAGIWTSSNGGAWWTELPYEQSDPNTVQGFCDLGYGGQCEYDLAIALDPAQPTTMYAAGVKAFRYDVAAAPKFENISGPFGVTSRADFARIHVDFHVLTFDAAGRLWLGSDGGVYRTTDRGATFQNLNSNLQLTQFYPGSAGRAFYPLVAGTQDNGTLRFDGTSWSMTQGGDGGYSALSPADEDIVYYTYAGQTISQSVRGGPGAVVINGEPGSPCTLDADECAFVFPLVPDPSDRHLLYAASTYVWRGTGTPGSGRWDAWRWQWERVGTYQFPTIINTIAIAPSDRNVIYAGGSTRPPGTRDRVPAELRVTSNNGLDWVPAQGLPVKPTAAFTDSVVHPQNPARAYVTVGGFGHGHVFLTTNGTNSAAAGGSTWTDLSGTGAGALPDVPVNAIAVDWRFLPEQLYVATDIGVFTSSDGGRNWERYGTGLPTSAYTDVLIDIDSERLVALSYGRGAYRVPISSGGGLVPWTQPVGVGLLNAFNNGNALVESRSASGASTVHTAVSGHDETSPLRGVFHTRSTTRGQNWSPPVRLSLGFQTAQRVVLAATGATVHAAWVALAAEQNAPPTAPRVIWYRASTDEGETWPGQPVAVSPNQGRVDRAALAAALDGETQRVYIAYTDAASGEVKVAVSSDGGATWETAQVGETTVSTAEGFAGSATVAASGRTVVLAWVADASGTLRYRASTDGGRTWAPAETVAADSNGWVTAAAQDGQYGFAWSSPSGIRLRLAHGGALGPEQRVVAFGPNQRYADGYGPALALSTAEAPGGATRSVVAVAWAQCERAGCDQESAVDLGWVESGDGGTTWSPVSTIASGTRNSLRPVNDRPSVVLLGQTRFVTFRGAFPGGREKMLLTMRTAPF